MENDNQQKLELNMYTSDEILSYMKEYVSEDSCNVVFVVTEKKVVEANEDEELAECYNKADLLISSEHFKVDDSGQDTDDDNSIDVEMINQITEDEEIDKLSVMLLTDDDAFSEVFENKINDMFDNLEYVGNYAVGEEIDDDLVINEINGRLPDVLVCALSNSQQEQWIMEHKTKMSVKLCVGLSGDKEEIFQKKETGFRWLAKLLGKSGLFGLMILGL